MPRKDQGWITFQASSEEKQILEQYCIQNHRTKTDVLRELIRGLRQQVKDITSPENVPQEDNKEI